MNDHEKWEEDVRARRNLILLAAGSALLVLILVLFWLNNRPETIPLAFTEEAPTAAAEGAQAQPALPADAPPAVAGNTVTDPNFDQRTLPARTPTVVAADDPNANRPPDRGERIVIGGNVVDQFEAAILPPEGWTYLPELGVSSIFELQENGDGQGHTVMLVDTQQNAGILQKEVNVALDPDTTLRWQWNLLDLPSDVPENTAATHDHFSIAVRFDNGQDLTYMWSADLLDGTSFRCPLPEWNQRETHLVVRSGEAGLNKWLNEERSVLADYKRYVGGELPTRITHVWLMASSAIQKGEGRAVFMDISVGGDGQRAQVL
jgi:hypothetical protein